MIRVAVNGALGRMGSLVIGEIKNSEDVELVAGFTRNILDASKTLSEDIHVSDAADLKKVLTLTKPDVLIDFTSASAAVGTVCGAAELGINLVVGTTGFTGEQFWPDEKSYRRSCCRGYLSQFHRRSHVFWRLLAVATAALKDYDIEVIEAHHNQKKDAPRGTALAAVDVLKNATGIAEIVHGRKGTVLRGKEIGVHAVRAGA